jgi:hypothetical protein
VLFDTSFKSSRQCTQINIVRFGLEYFEVALACVSAVDQLVSLAQIGSLAYWTDHVQVIVQHSVQYGLFILLTLYYILELFVIKSRQQLGLYFLVHLDRLVDADQIGLSFQ